MIENTANALKQFADAMGVIVPDDSLVQIIGEIELIGSNAKRLAAAMAVHVKSAPPNVTSAALHRAVRVLEDFEVGIRHALDGMTLAK